MSGVVSFAAFTAAGVVSGASLALGGRTVGVRRQLGGPRRLLGRLNYETFRRLVLALLIVTAAAAVATSVARLVD